MGDASSRFEIDCPCCGTTLVVDADTQAVLHHREKEKPKLIEDLGAAVQRLKAEPNRREEAFQKSLREHKGHQEVLSRKFDELLKQAKEDPDAPPPPRAFDLD